MDALTDGAEGRYVVETQSGSSYLIDLEQNTVHRTSSVDPTRPAPLTSPEMRLVAIRRCALSEALSLIVDLGIEGVPWAAWRSTVVVSITAFDAEEDR